MSGNGNGGEESHRLLPGNASTSAANGHSGGSSSQDEGEAQKPPKAMWQRVLTSIWAKLAIIAVVAVLMGVLLWKFPWGKIPGVIEYMRNHTWETGAPFFILNAIAIVVLLPGAAFQMVAGAVYGIWVGWLISFAGTSAGVLAAFLLGRYLFKESLSGWIIGKFPHYGLIESAIFKEDGWKLVWLLRITPGLPDSLLNYAMGLTSCSFSLFAMASCGSLAFYSFLYAYIGHASGDIIATIRGGEVGNAKLRLGLTIGSVVLGCITLVYLIVVLRRALNKVLAEQEALATPTVEEVLLAGAQSNTDSTHQFHDHTTVTVGNSPRASGDHLGTSTSSIKSASPSELAMSVRPGHHEEV